MKAAFFSLRNTSASATAALSVGSSRDSETTASPFGPYFLCISMTCGKFSLHGPQVVAQASTIVYFDLGVGQPLLELAPLEPLQLDRGRRTLVIGPASRRAGHADDHRDRAHPAVRPFIANTSLSRVGKADTWTASFYRERPP